MAGSRQMAACRAGAARSLAPHRRATGAAVVSWMRRGFERAVVSTASLSSCASSAGAVADDDDGAAALASTRAAPGQGRPRPRIEFAFGSSSTPAAAPYSARARRCRWRCPRQGRPASRAACVSPCGRRSIIWACARRSASTTRRVVDLSEARACSGHWPAKSSTSCGRYRRARRGVPVHCPMSALSRRTAADSGFQIRA